MGMLSWHIVTKAAYDAGAKSDDSLYFTSDTHEIFKGANNFTEACAVVASDPATPAQGRLYINSATLEGKIWNGTAWVTVIQPVQAALIAGDTAKPVSSKAVEDYVADEIAKVTGSGDLVADVAFDGTTNTFTVSMADGTSEEIALNNVAVDLVYDAATGKLNVKNAAGTTIGTGISLDLERFVKSASYDHDTRKITLVFNDDQSPVEIEIGDLVDTYTAKNSTTIALSVTGNEFVAEAIVATTEGNMLQKTDAGLFVAATDISGKQDKDVDAVAGNLAKFDANGNAIDAGYTAGAATLAGTSATVLATEAAVAAIRDALQTAIDGKIAKVETGHADEILVATADGQAAVSGMKVGGAALADSADAATLATEKAVKDYVEGYAVAQADIVAQGAMATTVAAASNEKVTSEKAVVDALTWKTTA